MRQSSLYPFSCDHMHAFYGIYVVDHCVQSFSTLHPKKFIGVRCTWKQCRCDFFNVLNKNVTISKNISMSVYGLDGPLAVSSTHRFHWFRYVGKHFLCSRTRGSRHLRPETFNMFSHIASEWLQWTRTQFFTVEHGQSWNILKTRDGRFPVVT